MWWGGSLVRGEVRLLVMGLMMCDGVGCEVIKVGSGLAPCGLMMGHEGGLKE